MQYTHQKKVKEGAKYQKLDAQLLVIGVHFLCVPVSPDRIGPSSACQSECVNSMLDGENGRTSRMSSSTIGTALVGCQASSCSILLISSVLICISMHL